VHLIRAVIFDFDGVLAPTAPDHFSAWQAVLHPRGIEPDFFVMRLNEGSPAYRILQAMASHVGHPLDDATAKSYTAEKNRHFVANCRTRPFAEIPHILDVCAGRGLKTAVATGTNFTNLQHVVGPELLQRFQALVYEGEYQRGKPYPDPFLVAAEKLGVPAQECLVVENAPLGIEAARAAGMVCAAVMTTLGREHLQKADVIVESHAELLNYLEKLTLS
jgi:beta-phosphoglucomutase